MANTIDAIVSCNISIESIAVSEASMSGLLIIGAGTEGSGEVMETYTNLRELSSFGYESNSAVYLAAATAFGQDPAPDKIYVMPVLEDEEPTAAVERALNSGDWYFILPAGIEHTKYNALSVYAETTEKMLLFTLENGEESPILQSGLMRTAVWRLAANQTTDYDDYLHVAIAAKISSYDPGSETWAFKQLSLVTPGEFTSSEVTAMDAACENYFVTISKKNITQGGTVLGDEWIDTIRFRDWLKNQIQINVLNVLLGNPKVQFTDPGISLIHNALLEALKAGQAAGGIAEDSYDEDGSKIAGYTVTVPLASSFTAAQRKARKLTGMKWTARLAGAIHAVELTGTLGN